MGDICEPASFEHAFRNVDCVFHCAAYINFQYPPNFDELERVNVMGTLKDQSVELIITVITIIIVNVKF